MPNSRPIFARFWVFLHGRKTSQHDQGYRRQYLEKVYKLLQSVTLARLGPLFRLLFRSSTLERKQFTMKS